MASSPRGFPERLLAYRASVRPAGPRTPGVGWSIPSVPPDPIGQGSVLPVLPENPRDLS